MKLLAALTGRERPTRTPSPTLPEPAIRTAWQAISLLLDHPATAFAHLGALSDAVATLPDGVREPLMRLVAHLAASDPVQVERDYVATFDVTRKCALHLTYYAFGDTRKRGIALVQFKQAYRRGGLEVTEAELPDHLCVLLEFGATIPEVRASAGDPRGASEASLEGPEGTFPIAWKLLNDHRAGVELLHLALEERRSPWTDAVTALRATLPALTGTQAEAVARLLAEGPPDEEVGMDAYALDPRLNPHPAADAELEGSYA